MFPSHILVLHGILMEIWRKKIFFRRFECPIFQKFVIIFIPLSWPPYFEFWSNSFFGWLEIKISRGGVARFLGFWHFFIRILQNWSYKIGCELNQDFYFNFLTSIVKFWSKIVGFWKKVSDAPPPGDFYFQPGKKRITSKLENMKI